MMAVAMSVIGDATEAREAAAQDDDDRWRAALARDRASDGRFWTGVITTGIYCRPSCAARHPKRQNVRFFASPDAAEAAGLRACKRCRPRDTERADIELVRRVCERIDSDVGAAPTLAQLSDDLGVSQFHLQRTFRRVAGVTPKQYAAASRARRFKSELRGNNGVTRALYDAGYGSSSRAYDAAASLGMTPATYGRRGLGAEVAYTIAGCALGRLLVAATRAGVCSVLIGDDDDGLSAILHDEFSRATTITRDDELLGGWVDEIVALTEGRAPRADLPLDIRATAFQRAVWQELRRIPPGATRTYGEVARAIGRPAASRAVGHACGSNPVSVFIPCHRVVGRHGTLTGYRWGIERKRTLLASEAATRDGAQAGPDSTTERSRPRLRNRRGDRASARANG